MDSKPIGMESRTSTCISDGLADFPYGYTLTQKKVKGFGGVFHGKVCQCIAKVKMILWALLMKTD